MRILAAAVVCAALLAQPEPLRAQEAGPAPAGSSPSPAAAGLPSAPIPYTVLRPKRRPAPAPKRAAPAPRPTSAAAATPRPPAQSAPPPLAPPVAGARLQPGQALSAAELEPYVDGLVRQAMTSHHIPGVTVAVVQNGQVVLKKGYGFASLSPARRVDPDRTLFRLGSVSKTFTWIAVMRQVEAGRMRLDQPVDAYLPPRVRVRDQGFETPVRVVDLMAHAAGFEDRALGQLFERDPDYVRPLELYLRRERPDRVRAPGLRASYSNYGAGLAGAAVAWTAKRPFERLMEEDLFLPLGMNRTTFREVRPPKAALPAPMPPALAADVAQGYRWTRAGFERAPYEYIGHVAPAGSASSTAGDMARYMLALLANGQHPGGALYSPRTAQAFRTPLLTTSDGINGWAHGFMAEPLPGGRRGFGHLGSTLVFRAHVVTAPELNLGVFVAANSASGTELVRDLPAAIVGAFYAPPPPAPRAGSPALAREAWRFTGFYNGDRRAFSGLEAFVSQITSSARVRVTKDGRLLTSDADGPKIWVPEGAPAQGRFVAMQGEERLAFRMRDGEGVAFQTSAGLQTFERTPIWRTPGAFGLLAGLTTGASLACLAGAIVRNRREVRENAAQSRAALIQNLQAGLWLISMACFAAFGVRALADPTRPVFDWPSPLLVTASACALVASALTISILAALPQVWRGGRRVDSWPVLRRLGFTLTTLIYAAFAVLLATSGALSPWNA